MQKLAKKHALIKKARCNLEYVYNAMLNPNSITLQIIQYKKLPPLDCVFGYVKQSI